MTEGEAKIREARLRRMLGRRGFLLQKSRARDPGAVTYGGYRIIDAQTDGVAAGSGSFPYSFDLDDVVEWIAEHDAKEKA